MTRPSRGGLPKELRGLSPRELFEISERSTSAGLEWPYYCAVGILVDHRNESVRAAAKQMLVAFGSDFVAVVEKLLFGDAVDQLLGLLCWEWVSDAEPFQWLSEDAGKQIESLKSAGGSIGRVARRINLAPRLTRPTRRRGLRKREVPV